MAIATENLNVSAQDVLATPPQPLPSVDWRLDVRRLAAKDGERLQSV